MMPNFGNLALKPNLLGAQPLQTPQQTALNTQQGNTNHSNHNNPKHSFFNSQMPMPINGDSSTFNINPLLRENILMSQYFKDLFNLQSVEEMSMEVSSKVKNAEPWAHAASGVPSTLFCCLYRLMLMRLSVTQIRQLMDHTDNPYVRCAGFLYMRYCAKPETIWPLLSKYLDDETVFKPALSQNSSMTIGQYVEELLTDQGYYGTRFPRIPIMIEREIKKKVMIHHEKKKRLKKNLENRQRLVPGAAVRVYDKVSEGWRKAKIEFVDEDMVKVSFGKAGELGVDDGIKQIELIEKQVEKGGEGVLLQEDFVSLQDIEIEDFSEVDAAGKAGAEDSDEEDVIARRRRRRRRRRRGLSSSSGEAGGGSRKESEETGKEMRRRENRKRRRNRHRNRRSRSRDRSDDSSEDGETKPDSKLKRDSQDGGRGGLRSRRDRSWSRERSRSRKRKHQRSKRDRHRSSRKGKRKENKHRRKKRRRDRGRRDSDESEYSRKRLRSQSDSSDRNGGSSDDSEALRGTKKGSRHQKALRKPKTGENDHSTEDKYLKEILRQEKQKAEAQSKKDYNQKAKSFKASLTQPIVNRRIEIANIYGGPGGDNSSSNGAGKSSNKLFDSSLLEGEEYYKFG